jgi:Fe-S-cluster containining protein
MTEIERLKQAILDHFPRLSESSSFTFACHPGVPCFNDCCGDVNIFLTPYDIIRLKHSLGVSSGEFLSKYTVTSCDEDLKYPIVLLRMNDDDAKSCPFVGEDGCRVYEARPWSCRTYPIGMASPMEGCESLKEEFYFLLEDGVCRGFKERKTQTVAEWLEDQGANEYSQMGQSFKELTLHEFFRGGEDLAPRKAEMLSLACYDLDRFRGFVLTSTFLDKFEVDAETRERIREDDVELLKLGYAWLRFALFGEGTLKIKKKILEARKQEFATQG